MSGALRLAAAAGLLLAALVSVAGCGVASPVAAQPPERAPVGGIPIKPPPLPGPSKCVEVSSVTTFTSCKDAGGFASTCASVTCPAGTTLTGGGGACAAGNSRLKSLFPRLSANQFNIACDSQGVAPQVIAICCKL
jgi:hypothetical protein